ncbi:hypothetical protein B0O99DRAFT_682560 [Bisporella sp. PMI_857]|nr:hypothetical protein B0O99DRAFT_682560 [Bisporella sp. PMI_857]
MDRYVSQVPHIRLRLEHLKSTKPLFANIYTDPSVKAMFSAFGNMAKNYGQDKTILLKLDCDLYLKEKTVWSLIYPPGTPYLESFPGRDPKMPLDLHELVGKLKIEEAVEKMDGYVEERAKNEAARSASAASSESGRKEIRSSFLSRLDPHRLVFSQRAAPHPVNPEFLSSKTGTVKRSCPLHRPVPNVPAISRILKHDLR